MIQEKNNEFPWPLLIAGVAVIVAGGAFAVRQWPIWGVSPEPVPAPAPGVMTAPPAPPAEPAQVFVPSTSAVIRIYLRPIDDSDASLQQLRELAPLLPRQRVSSEQPATPGAMMQDRFVRPDRRLPRTALFLASMATRESGQVAVYAPPAGESVYFPALPLGRASGDAPRLGSSRFRVSDPGSIAFSRIVAQPIEDSGPGRDGHVLDYEMPAGSISRQEVQALIERPDVEAVEAPTRVKFAGDGCTATETPFLDAAASAALQTRATNAARTIDVLIVDSGWPDAGTQKASLQRLYEMTNQVRGKYGMTGVTPVVPAFTTSGYDHAERIHRALQPLRALDQTSRVRLTYVPLSLAQDSRAILHELIMLSSLISLRGAYSGNASADHIAKARKDADERIVKLPPSPGLIMASDKFILDAVNRVAAAVADAAHTYYVANYSFTYEAKIIGYEPPPIQRGLGIAAAGNDDLDVNEKSVDLAHRAATDAHFVTVMNIDAGGGRDCKSSYIASDLLATAGVVGFTGSLGTESQTSFAAPRVAWLLALAEASNPSPVAVADSWFVKIRNRLIGARSSTQPYASIRIDALKLASLLD